MRLHQRGVSLLVVLGMISALALFSALFAKIISGKANIQSQYMDQASAVDLQRSADSLRTKVASLRITYGSIDPVISGNLISSASTLWVAQPLPANASTMALTGWVMTDIDRFIAPQTGEFMRVATIDVTTRVCTALNQLQIKSEDPVIASAANAFAGTNFTVSNAGFNAGLTADFFCAQGGGAGGEGRVYLGIGV